MEHTNENRRPGKQPENPRPPPPLENPPPKCPRCDSINTKFCYYNNYSASQPRYFCKTCRRYWTHGGALRNVPIGGSCRKGSKKSKATGSSTSSSCGESSTSTQLLPRQQPPQSPLSGNRNLANLANSYFSSTGFLSSLAVTMQSLSRPQGNNYSQLALSGAGGGSGQIGSGSGKYSGGAASTSHLSLLQSFNNENIRQQQPSYLNHHYFQQQQHQQQQIHQSDPRMVMWQQQNSRQTFFLQNSRQNPSNPNSASNSRAIDSWAQGMVVQQQQNNRSGPTDPRSMNNPNQWPDNDFEDLHGYGPPSPPA